MPQIVGKEVGEVGFGLMMLTYPGSTVTQEQAFAAMREALKQGSNFWNGGEFYGTPEHNSLHLLNEYFTKYPEDAEKVVLSIKGGAKPGSMDIDSSKENLSRSIEECLRVLDGKKSIDIFESARVDPNVPIEDAVAHMAEYVAAGKIGGIGLSETNAATVRKAAAVHKIAAFEVEISLWSTQAIENGTVQACGELGIPVVGYAPLGKGFLTGKWKTYDEMVTQMPVLKSWPRYAPENFDANLKLVDKINDLANKKGCTSAQVAIAWVVAQGQKRGYPQILALPGSSSVKRVAENSKTVQLDESDLATIDSLLQNFEVKGDRYPAHFMKQIQD